MGWPCGEPSRKVVDNVSTPDLQIQFCFAHIAHISRCRNGQIEESVLLKRGHRSILTVRSDGILLSCYQHALMSMSSFIDCRVCELREESSEDEVCKTQTYSTRLMLATWAVALLLPLSILLVWVVQPRTVQASNPRSRPDVLLTLTLFRTRAEESFPARRPSSQSSAWHTARRTSSSSSSSLHEAPTVLIKALQRLDLRPLSICRTRWGHMS